MFTFNFRKQGAPHWIETPLRFAVAIACEQQVADRDGCSVQMFESGVKHVVILVHAKDDDGKGFYQHFDFEPSASDPYHLLLIMQDLDCRDEMAQARSGPTE